MHMRHKGGLNVIRHYLPVNRQLLQKYDAMQGQNIELDYVIQITNVKDVPRQMLYTLISERIQNE